MTPIQSRFNYNCQLTGIHVGMDETDYRAQPALSTSELKLITNPRRFWQRATGETAMQRSPAMDLGTLFHTYILEPDRFANEVTVCPDEFSDRRTKVGKQWWEQHGNANTIREPEFEQIKKMAKAFFRLPDTEHIAEWQTELSLFSKRAWPIASKCRIDAYDAKTETVYDIKTIAPGGAHPRKYTWQSKDLKYHWQQWNYCHLARHENLPVKKWVWLVVESGGDYLSATYEFDQETVFQAGKEVTNAMDTLLRCIDSDTWPDYTPDKPMIIGLY